jgi:hypothetical protein
MTELIQSNFKILNQIIFYSDYEIFFTQYQRDEDLLNKGYKFYPETLDFPSHYALSPDDPNRLPDLIPYDAYFVLQVDKIFKEIQIEIINQSYKNPEFESILDWVYQEFIGLFNELIHSGEREYLVKRIFKFQRFAKSKYTDVIENHSFYSLQKPTPTSQGYFLPKQETKISFFQDLYLILIDHQILDSEKTSRDAFVEVLTSSHPKECLQFYSNNYLAVYVLDQLTPFFTDFNTTKIGSSGMFKNKQGKFLTAQDINTARNRGKGKFLNEKSDFVQDLEELRLNYNL